MEKTANDKEIQNSGDKKGSHEDEVADRKAHEEKQEETSEGSWKWYIISCLLMLGAGILYVGIFFLSHKVTKIQWSHLYSQVNPVSPYYVAQENQQYCSALVTETASDLYPDSTDYRTVTATAMSIVFSWIMWKLPLSIFTLSLAWINQNKIIRFVTWGVSVLILIGLDIVLSAFVPKFYGPYIFFGVNFVIAIIISIINNRPDIKRGLMAAALPLFMIAFVYFFYVILWPFLFQKYGDKFPDAAVYVQVYLYILWDLLLYSILLIMNNLLPEVAKPFSAIIHFLLLGYFVGMTLLVGVTEVQFYYLVGYMLFRNFFSNWVMWKWEGVTNNPPCLWIWIAPYYLSYAFNFLPLIEIGNIIVSKSFYSQEFSQACMILSYYPTSEYPYNTDTPANSYNTKLRGYIFWVGAMVIWVVSTASQKYPRRKPTPFDFFFNLMGIYLFYIGISSGLELPILAQKTLL